MPLSLTVSLIPLLFAILITCVSSACYYPNGTDVTTYISSNSAYSPCMASAEASMCCRINLTQDADKDHCRSDGLCDSPNHVFTWRESCTDPTWRSPHCQKLCLEYGGLDPFGVSAKGVNVDVTQCNDGSFCCGIGNNGSTCCIEGRGVWMVDGKETSVNPNSTSPPSANSSATSSAAATNPSSQATVSHHAHTGAIVGGAVGGLAASLLLIGLLYWIIRRRRQSDAAAQPVQDIGPGKGPRAELSPAEEGFRPELSPEERRHEVDSTPRTELDGGASQEWKHNNSPRELAHEIYV